MARRKTSSLPGRILARLFLVFFGFLLGLALFTPWNKIWASTLASLDEKLPSVGLSWDSIDKDGPFGFRVNELRVRLADTPGSLSFHQARVRIGFNPLARVKLDTNGSECELNLFRNGVFEFEGDLNLTALLGGSDFKGIIRAAGRLFLPAGAILPENGWVDIRSQQLVLPSSKTVNDLAFTAELSGPAMDIRDFSIRLPIAIKSSGRGAIDARNLYNSAFELTGQITVGHQSVPYETKGTLKEILW